jgi:hypothetical protein
VACEHQKNIYNNRKKKRNTKIQKPWFDLECKFERQYYRKMKRKHKFRNSDNSRKELKEAEKKYKKQMDTSIRKYRQKIKKGEISRQRYIFIRPRKISYIEIYVIECFLRRVRGEFWWYIHQTKNFHIESRARLLLDMI